MTDIVQRREDMSCNGTLTVCIDCDGDMNIAIFEESTGSYASAEFCTRFGGGKSPRTHKALKALYEAMIEDNSDPFCISRNGRNFGE